VVFVRGVGVKQREVANYRPLRCEKTKLWILFRVTGSEYVAVIRSPKRKVVMKAYKKVKGFSK